MWRMWRIAIVVWLAPAIAAARPPGMTDTLPNAVLTGRDTGKVMVGAGGAVFANHPNSISDEGFAVFVNKPLWLGDRYRYFQWALDAAAVGGYGTNLHHGYVIAAAQFGPNFYLGSVFGLEFRFGAGAMMQLGERNVPGIVFSGGGGYVFRFWDDDRKRVKLWASMNFGGYLKSDPMNDLGANAGAMGLGLAYETPY